MKTIREIAGEIGVSKQAVEKRISREPLRTLIQAYIDKRGNTKYISAEGEKLIKAAFEKNLSIDKNANRQANVYSDVHSENIEIMQELKQAINELTAVLKIQTARESAKHKTPKRKTYPSKSQTKKCKSAPIGRLMRNGR
jgi:predicted transcriptional regulator